MPKLTERQKRFIDFYIQSGNASESARRAGYSAKSARATGIENLEKPYIKAAIQMRLEELHNERTANTKEILEFLSAEMLAKVHGMFITRQEVEISGNVPVVIRDDI